MTCAEVMTPSPTCCQSGHTVVEAAEMMRQRDVGLVPVVTDQRPLRLVGVVTDRDLAVKVVAAGRDPQTTVVGEVMTRDPVACRADATVEAVMDLMASHQLRRVPIVDLDGSLVGIVAQADIATRLANPQETGQVVQAISEPA
jgi:CBS domain-containing protein